MHDYELIRSRRRTIAIEIDREGRIKVRAPYNVGSLEIRRFVEEKSGWIDKNLQRMRERRDAFPDQDAADGAEITSPELVGILTEEARMIIPPRVEHFAPIVGVDYGDIRIRHQRTRWGSCSAKGNLNFNCLLVRAPEEVLDYVVVHELSHRIHMDHSRAFWAEVARVCPEYRARRRWLREHGDELMRLIYGTGTDRSGMD